MSYCVLTGNKTSKNTIPPLFQLRPIADTDQFPSTQMSEEKKKKNVKRDAGSKLSCGNLTLRFLFDLLEIVNELHPNCAIGYYVHSKDKPVLSA